MNNNISIKQARLDHPGEVLLVECRRTCKQCDLDMNSVYYIDPHDPWVTDGHWGKVVSTARKRQTNLILREYLPKHEHPDEKDMVLNWKMSWIEKPKEAE